MADSIRARRIRYNPGDVFAIPLGEADYGYCRHLSTALVEFFDVRSRELLPVERLRHIEIAFAVWVMDRPFVSGAWPKIGHLEPTKEVVPTFYKRDPLTKRLFIYQGGRERPASLEDCQGLESVAVWSAGHIEDRLRDHFAGRPNKWVESLQP